MKKSILAVLIGGTLLSMVSSVHASDSETNKLNDAAWTLMFGGTPHLDNDGDFDGFLGANDEIQVGPNGEWYGYREDTGLYGAARAKLNEQDEAIADVNDRVDVVTSNFDATAADFDARITQNTTSISNHETRITQNTNDIAKDRKRNDAAWNLMFGGTPHLDDNGDFDGFLRKESDKLVVGPNGEFYGYKENAGLYGKYALKQADQDKQISKNTARIDGNDKRIENLQEVKADKADLNATNDRVDNIVNKGNTAIGLAHKAGDKVQSHVTDIKGAVAGAVGSAQESINDFDERITANKNRIDDSQVRIGKVENVAAQNTKDITAANKEIGKLDKRVSATEQETARLDDVKADKADLEAQVARGEAAYDVLNGRINTAAAAGSVVINGAVKLANFVKNNGSDIKANVEGKFNNAIDNSVTNVINTEGSKLNVAINGAKDTANDFDARITANANGVAGNAADISELQTETARLESVKADRTELAALEAKGEAAHTELNGKVDNAIKVGGDRLTTVEGDVAHINNQIDNAKSVAASVKGKVGLVIENGDTIVEGANNALNAKIDNQINAKIDNAKTTVINNGSEIKAVVGDKVTNITNNITESVTNDVMANIGDIVIDANNETVVNIKNEISKDVTNQLKLDAKDIAVSIKKDIVEGNNETVNNITGKLGEKAKDFQDQIDGLEAKKADRTELKDLEARGAEVAGKLGDRITNVEGDVTNLNGKVDTAISVGGDRLTVIEGDINNAKQIAGKVKGAVDVVINNGDSIIEGATGVINGKVENITNNITGDVLNQIGDIVIDGNSETVVNIKNEISKDVTNQLKLDAKDLVVNIANGGNETVNNIAGKVNAKVEGAKGAFEDLSEQVNANTAGVAANNTAIANLDAKGQAAYNDLNARKADKADLDAMGDRVTNVEGDVANINGKIDNATNVAKAIKGKVDVAIDNAGAITTAIDNSLNAKIDGRVDAKIDATKTEIVNNITNNKDGIKGAVSLAYEGAKNDITNNVLNTVQTGDNQIVVDIKKDIKNEIDNSITNAGKDLTGRIDAEVGRGEGAYTELNAKIDALNHGTDVDLESIRNAIQQNADSIQTNVARGEAEAARLEDKKADRTELADLESKGTNAYNLLNGKVSDLQGDVAVITNNVTELNNKVDTNIDLGKKEFARIDNSITTIEGDVASINGKLDYVEGNVTTWVNDGKTYVDNTVNAAIDQKVTDIHTGINNAWTQNKGDVINNVNQRVESYTNNVVNGLKLDAKNAAINIGKGVANGDNNIANSVGDIVIGKGKDFQDQIDATNDRVTAVVGTAEEMVEDTKAAGIKAGTTAAVRGQAMYTAGVNEAARLEDVKANKTDLDDLENRLQDQINNAVTPEQIEEALNNYKLQVKARLIAAAPGAKDALDKAKEDAINEAKGYVKAEIDATINKGKETAKDAIDANKDKAKDVVLAGKDLNDRVTKVEGQIAYAKDKANAAAAAGKDAAGKVIAKAPAIKGNVSAKVDAAKSYAKNVNAKADTAIAMGNQNAQDIVTERNDRIQGQRDTLKSANAYTDSKFGQLNDKVNKNREHASRGISSVAAMSNIPGLDHGADFTVGAGIGSYDGYQSIAVGANARINENTTTRFSVSASNGGSPVFGAGIGFSF